MTHHTHHRSSWSLFAIAVAVTCVVASTNLDARADEEQPSPDTGSAEIVWYRSYDQALAAAYSANRHVIAEFYTDWCPWCRKLEDSTLSHPSVEAMADSFVFVRVNVELDTARASLFGIDAYPTTMLIEPNGNEVDRIVGYVPPEEFVKRMDQYLLGEGTLWALDKLNRDRPSDPETIYKLALKHMERGEYDKARPLFQKAISLDQSNNTGLADDAQFSLAMMYRKDRQWFKAIEEFRVFLDRYPKSKFAEDAELYIPWLNARAGDNEEALERYREFLDEHGGSSEADWVREQISRLEAGQEPSTPDDNQSSSEQ